MKSLSIAILVSDARTARALAVSLCSHFHAIHAAHSIEELREVIAKQRIQVAVVDIEIAGLAEIERLHHDFTGTCIVCTHRLADDEMWTAALNAGACDICTSVDTRGIVAAALRSMPAFARSVAA